MGVATSMVKKAALNEVRVACIHSSEAK